MTTPPVLPTATTSTPRRKPMNYRWLLVLFGLAIIVSILLVYAQNRVYEPSNPFQGGTGDHVHAFALDPYASKHMYLGAHYGFFRSTDGGASWTRLNGNGGITKTLVATSISISPRDARTVYVTGYNIGSGNATGIYVTHDDGSNWQNLATGGAGNLPDPRVLFVTAGWADPAESYAYTIDYGLYRTLDRGAHWQQIAPPFSGQVTTFMPIPTTCSQTTCPEQFYVGTTQGLYTGTAATPTAPVVFNATPLITGYVYAVAPHHGDQPYVYVSSEQGLFRADGPGGTLTGVTTVAQGAPTLTSLAVSGKDARLLFGVTQQNIVTRSQDGGKTWNAIGASLLTRGLSQLSSGLRQATGSNTPQWAGGQNKFLSILQTDVQSDSTHVFAAISFPTQLFLSGDGGQLWTDLSQGSGA